MDTVIAASDIRQFTIDELREELQRPIGEKAP
jgi:hypothetical protein